MENLETKWDTNALDELREKTGLSLDKIASATGIPLASLYAYASGRIAPSVSVLVTLADYFAVPLDYLVGRLPEDKAKAVTDNYAKNFMELRKAPYEAYLYGRRELSEATMAEGEAPWPYNLLDAIFHDEWQETLSEDQLSGLQYVLNLLDERSRECVYAYYADGRTLQETGAMFGISRERVRQILTKTFRILRHPTKAEYLLYGFEGAQRRNRYEAESRRLSELEAKLALRETEVRLKLNSLDAKEKDVSEREREYFERERDYQERTGEMSIYDMDMTVRATNILRRRGARTLSDVVTILDTGRFHTLRGVGKTVLSEVTGKVKWITGKDYTEIYKL